LLIQRIKISKKQNEKNIINKGCLSSGQKTQYQWSHHHFLVFQLQSRVQGYHRNLTANLFISPFGLLPFTKKMQIILKEKK